MAVLDHPQLQPWVQKYEALEKRERLAVVAMAAFFTLLILYALVWQPIYDFNNKAKSDYQRQLELLQYMRSTEADARSTGGPSAGLSGQPLLQSVSVTAQQIGIAPSRIQPDGSAVSVWFSAVAFNDLMRLLERLNERGITVRQISIDREEAPGRVNARILLRGA